MSERVDRLIDELVAELSDELRTSISEDQDEDEGTSIPVVVHENGDISVDGIKMLPSIDDPDSLKPYERVYFPEFDIHGVSASYRYRYLPSKDRDAAAFTHGYAFSSTEAATMAGQLMATIFTRLKRLRTSGEG